MYKPECAIAYQRKISYPILEQTFIFLCALRSDGMWPAIANRPLPLKVVRTEENFILYNIKMHPEALESVIFYSKMQLLIFVKNTSF